MGRGSTKNNDKTNKLCRKPIGFCSCRGDHKKQVGKVNKLKYII